jgi:dTDP-4-dehydrorhamnose 3,5-epimerase
LSAANGQSLLISEGIGHAFLALENGTVANYLCTSEFNPASDKTITPLDPILDISFSQKAREYGIQELKMSPKDLGGLAFQPK